MKEMYIEHNIERDIVKDVTPARATIQLANGMQQYIKATGEGCPRNNDCTVSMICNAIDLVARVSVGCIKPEGVDCPMENRAQVESDVMDIIDEIEQ